MLKGAFIIISFCLAFVQLNGQDTIAYDLTLPEVSINQSRIKDYTRIPLKFEQIDSAYIANNRGLGLGDILQKTSGLFTASTENFSQDMRISIRGFGMRSAFGIRGIKLMLDGLPESTPDGQADVDNIDPSLLSTVNVLKGPASGIYSNASGGVIEMASLWPTSENEASIKSTIGSNGLFRTSLSYGQSRAKRKLFLSVGGLQYQGFREFSAYSNYTFLAKSMFIFPKSTLQFIANGFHSPDAEDAGGITLQQSMDEPRSARLQNVDFSAGESVSQQKLGVIFQKKISLLKTWQTTGFAARRTFSNQLPFANGGQVSFNRVFYGGHTTLSFLNLLSDFGKLDLGLDMEAQNDHRTRNDNLKTDSGELRLDQNESFSTIGLFSKFKVGNNKTTLVANGRLERINLSLEDLFLSDGNQGGDQTFYPLSGGLDFTFAASKLLTLSASSTTGFETPTLTEISNNPQGGGFANLTPARTFNNEIGIGIQNKKLSIKANVFMTTSSNELLPYELPETPGRIFYKNGGKSNRKGLEYDLSFLLMAKTSFGVSGVFNQMTFTNDQNVKNRLPGLPGSQVNINGQTQLFKAVTFSGQLRYQGQLYANEANTVSINPVWFSNVGLQSSFTLGKIQLEPNAGIQYILSDLYYSNIFINAAGGRYYEVGPKTNIYFSLKLSIL
ncbi:MAG: TonB-dependent receptor plug domain-containing protein [Saprospiraceae bacterium]|nr:TonB-dependent receptor plug domain-containing protein [Saprospiraceae bacterium]